MEATDGMIRNTGRTWFSVEEVCRAAGFTRGAFYSSYGRLEQLLIDVHERQNDDLLDTTQRSAAPLLASDELLDGRTLVARMLDANPADQPRIALRAALVARANHDAALALALDQQVERLREGLQAVYSALVDKAGRRMTVAPEVFTRAVMAAQAGAASQFTANHASNRQVRVLTITAVAEGLTELKRRVTTHS